MREWLAGEKDVSLKEIRRRFGKEAMDEFISNHEDWGFYFCEECNRYVVSEDYDALNTMCFICREAIENV